MNKIAIFLSFYIGILATACNAPKKEEKTENPQEVPAKEAPKKKVQTEVEKSKYPISSPESMFSFMQNKGVEYADYLVNDVNHVSHYVDPVEKALNFGIYTTDIAYTSSYQDIEMTVELYKTIKRLGAEMNIAEMMTTEMMQKMQENMQDPDSLAEVAAQAYYQAVDFLEANRQNGKLALMSLGGWIESVYIVIHATDGYQEESPTLKKLIEQKSIFKNLHNYLEKNKNEIGVEEILAQLTTIKKVLDGFPTSEKAKTNISETQYTALKEAIKSYREEIVSVPSN